MLKKIAVVGSRGFNDYSLLERTLTPYLPFVLVSGGARGADSLAERFADKNNLEKIIFKPDWDKYGKRAGFLRNIKIIDESDMVIAFWDGNSSGTKSSIDLAREKNKELSVVRYNKEYTTTEK